jgi:hypothetical protein
VNTKKHPTKFVFLMKFMVLFLILVRKHQSTDEEKEKRKYNKNKYIQPDLKKKISEEDEVGACFNGGAIRWAWMTQEA